MTVIARSAFRNPASYPRSSPSCPAPIFVMLLQKILDYTSPVGQGGPEGAKISDKCV